MDKTSHSISNSYWNSVQTDKNDIVIIGAGFTGLRCAIRLKEERPNWQILVLDKLPIGAAASSRNAGFACFGSPTELIDDLRLNSRPEVVQTLQKRYSGIQKLKKEIEEFKLNLHQDGGYEVFSTDDRTNLGNLEEILRETNSLCEEAGIGKEVYTARSVKSFHTNFSDEAFYNAIEYNFNPSDLHNVLESKARNIGVTILRGITVFQIQKSIGYQLHSTFGEINTQRVVLCNNGGIQEAMNLGIDPGRGQILLTEEIEGLRLKGNFHAAQGYYYFRNVGNRILLGGGRHLFKQNEQTLLLQTSQEVQQHLIHYLKSNILVHEKYQNVRIDNMWAGTMAFRNDGAKSPKCGKSEEGIFYCAGFGGMGVALSATYSSYLAELILND